MSKNRKDMSRSSVGRISSSLGTQHLDGVKLQLLGVGRPHLVRRRDDLLLAAQEGRFRRLHLVHAMYEQLGLGQRGQRVRVIRTAGVVAERVAHVLHRVPREGAGVGPAEPAREGRKGEGEQPPRPTVSCRHPLGCLRGSGARRAAASLPRMRCSQRAVHAHAACNHP